MSLKTVTLREVLANEFSQVSDVEAVLTAEEPSAVRVFTIVEKSTPELRALIFDRECAVIDEFKERDFDFDIITRHGRDLASLVGDTGLEVAYLRK
jgi:hypothetical protein